ncbi:hypothetical protein DIPPA_29152 [Diplonema papillatum]|nr:hypothetical protein DIPPA_29152 [Diplonema papillatum]
MMNAAEWTQDGDEASQAGAELVGSLRDGLAGLLSAAGKEGGRGCVGDAKEAVHALVVATSVKAMLGAARDLQVLLHRIKERHLFADLPRLVSSRKRHAAKRRRTAAETRAAARKHAQTPLQSTGAATHATMEPLLRSREDPSPLNPATLDHPTQAQQAPDPDDPFDAASLPWFTRLSEAEDLIASILTQSALLATSADAAPARVVSQSLLRLDECLEVACRSLPKSHYVHRTDSLKALEVVETAADMRLQALAALKDGP